MVNMQIMNLNFDNWGNMLLNM